MKNFVKKGIVAGVAVAAVVVSASVPSLAQAPSPEDRAKNAVETRQAVFKLLGWNMGPLGGMLRNQVPFDAATAKNNGENIAALGKMIPALFEMDTREFDVETEALDRVWGAKSTFDEDAMNLVKAAENLIKVADGGNEGAVKGAMAQVGKACGACHDDFRQDD